MLTLPIDDPQVRLILIDSDNPSHRQYLYNVVQNYDFDYVRFSGEDIHIHEALNQLAQQYDGIVDDIVILDECDRLSASAYRDILNAILSFNPDKVIVFSRQLLWSLTDDLLPIIYIVSDIRDGMPSNSEQPILNVSAFGVGQARFDGRTIDFSNNPLLHEFFFYILSHKAMLRADALDAFWGTLTHVSAVSNFHVARNNLHQLLGVEFLVYTGTHYERNPKINLNYDVDMYCQQLNNISYGDTSPSSYDYRKLYDLYKGDFLTSSSSDWVLNLRQKLRQQHSEVCFALGKSAVTVEESLGYYAQAYHFNPYREDVAEAIMTSYINQDLPCDALDVYATLSHNLHQGHNIKPSKKLSELAEKIGAKC